MSTETKTDMSMLFIGILLTACMTMGFLVMEKLNSIDVVMLEKLNAIDVQMADNKKYLVTLGEVKDDLLELKRHVESLENYTYGKKK